MDIKTRFNELDSVYLIKEADSEEWYTEDLYTIQGICIIIKNDKIKITYTAHKTASNDFTVFNGLREYHLFADKEKALDRCWMLNEKQASQTSGSKII